MKPKRHAVFFGCDFDPNPDIDSIRRKLFRYIQAADREDIRSPYDIFVNSLGYHSESALFRFGCKYPCPGWISAIPKFDKELYPEMYRKFIDEGGCLDYTTRFGQYVASDLLEGELPISIGVDHCLAGGIIRPLSQRYNDLVVVTFDAHLDAFSPCIRNNLVGYMREHSSQENDSYLLYEFHEGTFTGNYDTGSFLNYLIREETLPGNNLLEYFLFAKSILLIDSECSIFIKLLRRTIDSAKKRFNTSLTKEFTGGRIRSNSLRSSKDNCLLTGKDSSAVTKTIGILKEWITLISGRMFSSGGAIQRS